MKLSPRTSAEINYTDAGKLINEASSIIIIAHYRPDGDAIGSCLALAASLQALGKDVTCYNRDEVPQYLTFLERSECRIHPLTSPVSADLLIALDCATIERLGAETIAHISADHVLTIDHHITNEQYGDSLILTPTAAATGEILCELIEANDFPLPDQARDNLYVAISTDTGSLQYSNSSAKTYQTMANLVAKGANVANLNSLTYFNHNVRRVEILRECLQSFHLAHQGQVSHWQVSHADQEKVGVQAGDMEGLMDLLRGIAGVRVCFTLEEAPSGIVRLSMRSKDENVDVSKICAHFGGGGHRMAAGAAINDQLENCAQLVLAEIQKAL